MNPRRRSAKNGGRNVIRATPYPTIRPSFCATTTRPPRRGVLRVGPAPSRGGGPLLPVGLAFRLQRHVRATTDRRCVDTSLQTKPPPLEGRLVGKENGQPAGE